MQKTQRDFKKKKAMKKKVVVVRTSAGMQQEGLQPVGLLPSVGAQVGADNVQPCIPQL